MTNYYDLLGVPRTAEADEIKRAFRKEIARYHPDKVQHLGPEFQEMAAGRAAALTEAYRILMDQESRRRYDDALHQPGAAVPHTSAARPDADVATPAPEPRPAEAPKSVDPPVRREAPAVSDFLRRAVLAKLKDSAATLGGTPVSARGFDALYQIEGRKVLFRRPEPAIRLAAKLVPQVDATSIEEAWGAAMRTPGAGETFCLLVIGSGIAPARELAATVAELRRKTRSAVPVLIPVDVRDWSALFPPETPPPVRALVERLRSAD